MMEMERMEMEIIMEMERMMEMKKMMDGTWC